MPTLSNEHRCHLPRGSYVIMLLHMPDTTTGSICSILYPVTFSSQCGMPDTREGLCLCLCCLAYITNFEKLKSAQFFFTIGGCFPCTDSVGWVNCAEIYIQGSEIRLQYMFYYSLHQKIMVWANPHLYLCVTL